MSERPREFANNCPIREYTGDGKPVGRCWYSLVDGKCRRHGDVSEAVKRYAETGKLTDETELPKRSLS